MNKKQLIQQIALGIEGQGNQVDLGSVLAPILQGVLSEGVTIDVVGNVPSFDEDTNYKSGDIVKVDGTLYQFTKAHIGEWSANDVKVVTLSELFGVIEGTWQEIIQMRNNGTLVAGTMYRITDYVATTTQPETRSANHPFDLILTAVSNNAFSEDVVAVQHEGDTYFNNVRLSAWKIKYTIDNDTLNYAWAQNEITLQSNGRYVRTPIYDENGHWAWVHFYADENIFDYADRAYTDAYPIVGGTLYEGEYSGTTQDDAIVAINQGKGVIYHMVDEYGNECPYDFKGIQFLRSEDWCDNHSKYTEEVLGGNIEDYWFYTLTLLNEEREVLDASIVGNSGKYLNDENKLIGVYGNKFGICNAYNAWYESYAIQALGKNVIVNFLDDEGLFYGCYGNTFLSECYYNTIGNTCNNNTFGNNCYSNTFGSNCNQNTFGSNCNQNTFEGGCYSNTFRNCYSNTFGNDCYSNTFRNCYSNTFGNDCFSNTFRNCNQNIFGNECYSNTFRNCNQNIFGNNCYSNTFGNGCNNNTVEDYVCQLTLFEGVVYCAITGGTSTSSYVQNAQILNGTQGQSENNRLTISFQQKKKFTQIAGLDESGAIVMWIPAEEHK